MFWFLIANELKIMNILIKNNENLKAILAFIYRQIENFYQKIVIFTH